MGDRFNKISRRYLVALSVFIFISCLVKPVLAEDWLYTVRKGDTLWGLCEKYTSVKDCWLKVGPYNGVTFPRVMPPGTRIKFPIAWLKVTPIPVTLTFVRGHVDVQKELGDAKPAHVGDQVFIGDSVITHEGSATLLFADGSVSVLSDNSSVKMDLLSVNDSSAIVDSRIVLRRGKISTKVPKYIEAKDNTSAGEIDPTLKDMDAMKNKGVEGNKETVNFKKSPQRRSRFQITTPSAVAAVRGTDFSVSANETGDEMRGAVYSGEIVISKNGAVDSKNNSSVPNTDNQVDQKSLPVGFGIFVDKNKPLPQPIALLDSPDFHEMPELRALPLSLSWFQVADATGYSVSVYNAELKNQLLLTEETVESQWTSTSLSEGCYSVSVRAIDINDLYGHGVSTEVCVARKPKAPSVIYDAVTKQISWSSVENADIYRVEFSDTENFQVIKESPTLELEEEESAEGLRYSFDFVDAVASASFVRVIPMHPTGLEGDASNVIEIETDSRGWLTGLITFVILLTAL